MDRGTYLEKGCNRNLQSMVSFLLVGVQIGCLVALVVTGPVVASGIWLIVEGMGQFMQHGIGVFGPLTWIKQPPGLRYMDMFHQTRIVTIGDQPAATRVVLHIAKLVVPVDPDAELSQPHKSIWGNDIGDALQVVGKPINGSCRLPLLLQKSMAFRSPMLPPVGYCNRLRSPG